MMPGKSILGGLLLAAVASAGGQIGTATKPKIDIVVRTSRSQVTAGSGFGLNAEIKNNSDAAVFLVPQFATLMPPPELDRSSSGWSGNIPAAQSLSLYGRPEYWLEPVRLGPGNTITAFWTSDPQQMQEHWYTKLGAQLAGRIRLLYFTPGEYTIKFNILYWPDEASARSQLNGNGQVVHGPASNYETQSTETKVLVVAPQSVILTGAVIGGLIAYFLLPNIRIRPKRIDVWGIVTAMLLSSIVTIILARVSETQFLVRVTINDVWGAIAVGFITSSSGVAILNRYGLSRFDQLSEKDKGEGIAEDEKEDKASSAAGRGTT